MSAITVYRARKIITLNPMQPEATHVAVRDGRILSVGSLERVREWGAFDLDERFADKVLMPGLVEGHCHLKEGGMWELPYLGWFDRRDPEGMVWPGLRSMDAVVARLAEVDAQMTGAGRGDAEPLIAWGFDPIYFGGERMTVEHLDRASRGAADRRRPRQRPPDERQHGDAARWPRSTATTRSRASSVRRAAGTPASRPASCRSRRRCSSSCARSATPACSGR